MNYRELRQLFCDYESKRPRTHLTACITFSSFGSINRNNYSWLERTYMISSDCKAFQPHMGGCSIFGSCLDKRTDQNLRLDLYMRDERGGKDGWVVEDCYLLGYLLTECSGFNIQSPDMFYTHNDAVECMLSRLAQEGELDMEQLKNDYIAGKELFEEGQYSASRDSAWLTGSREDWHWKIQPVHIYGPLKMVFPETEADQSLICGVNAYA